MGTWTSCPDSTSASDSATAGNRVRYRGIFSRRSRAVRYAQQRCYCIEEETLSPHLLLGEDGDSSDYESDCVTEGQGCRVFELDGVRTALQGVRCGECGAKGLAYGEDFSKRQGLYIAPYLLCNVCGHQIDIPFSSVDNSKSLVVNRLSLLTNVQAALAPAYICCLAYWICLCLCQRMCTPCMSKRSRSRLSCKQVRA